MKLTLALATTCALLSAPAFAQSPTTPQAQPHSQTTGVAPANAAISTPDFVNRVIMSDMFDTQAAKIAEQKGDSSDRNFARREAVVHAKATDGLKAIVTSGKVKDASVPTALDSEHQQRLDRLQKLSGKQFDEAYNKDAVQNHDNLIAMIEQYARNGNNTDVKQWASKTQGNRTSELSQQAGEISIIPSGAFELSAQGSFGALLLHHVECHVP